MTRGTATYSSEDVEIEFSGSMFSDETGTEVQDIAIEKLTILGVEFDTSNLEEAFETAILEKADDVEFTEVDSSDYDDLDD